MTDEINLVQLSIENSALQRRIYELQLVIQALQDRPSDEVRSKPSRRHAESDGGEPDSRPVYHSLLESMGEGAALVDRKGVILYCNRMFADLFQGSAQDIAGTSLETYFPADAFQSIGALIRPAGIARSSGSRLKTETRSGIPVLLSIGAFPEDGTEYRTCIISNLAQAFERQSVLASGNLAEILRNSTSDAVILCNPAEQIIEANAEALTLCGMDPLYKSFDLAFPIKTFTQSNNIIQNTLLGETFVNIPAVIGRLDGVELNLILNSYPLRGDDGQVIAAVVTARNVTAQKLVENQLKLSEEQYQQLYGKMPDGFGLFEALFDSSRTPYDYRFLEANDAMLQLMGMSREKLRGKTFNQLHPDFQAAWKRSLDQTAVYQMPVLMKGRHISEGKYADGILFSPRPGHIAFILTDITEKVRYEEELRASQERLTIIADGIPVILAYVDRNERYLYVNQAFTEWFGSAREQVIGKAVREVIGDRSYEITRANIQQALKGEKSSMEFMSSWKNARMHLDFLPHVNQNGETIAYYTLIQVMHE